MSRNLIFLLNIFLIFIITSCKTSEKNYYNAYKTAKAKQEKEIDSQTALLIKNEKYGNIKIINGDSIRIKTDFLSIVEDSLSSVPKYNVSVGCFKQIFNARKLKERLINNSFHAYILKDRYNRHYVIVRGFEDLNEAATCVRTIKNRIGFPITTEPFIISSAK